MYCSLLRAVYDLLFESVLIFDSKGGRCGLERRVRTWVEVAVDRHDMEANQSPVGETVKEDNVPMASSSSLRSGLG